MAISNRRSVLQLIGGAAACAAIDLSSVARAAGPAIAIPTRPFVLRRELERGLARNASLRVTREWRGHFRQESDGTTALGEQISCTVDAPAVLEPIAAIERERIAPGPFPARLDAEGRMMGHREAPATGREAAVQAAITVLRQSGTSASDLQAAHADLGQLARASDAVISDTPPDLFFPLPGEASDRRELALPGGETGEVLVELSASAGPGGLLERFERRIVTRIGEDVRLSRETWALRMA